MTPARKPPSVANSATTSNVSNSSSNCRKPGTGLAPGTPPRVLTAGILDPERETSVAELLATLELPLNRFQAELGSGRSTEVIDPQLKWRAGDDHADVVQPRGAVA